MRSFHQILIQLIYQLGNQISDRRIERQVDQAGRFSKFSRTITIRR